MEPRPTIPAGVKRELRQRCGFGCVICGSPIYDYEHLYGWKNTGHDPDKMTLLCPDHHREKTAGRMPITFVERHNAAPFSAGRRFTKGHPLYFTPGRAPELELGNVGFLAQGTDRRVGISVDDRFAIGVGVSASGHPIVDIDMRDLDNHCVLRVANGELRSSTSNWDVRFEGTRLRVQRSPHRTVIDLRFDAPRGLIEVSQADFSLNHVRVLVGTAALNGGFELADGGGGFSHLTLDGGGISIGESPSAPTLFRMEALRAYGAPPAPFGSAFRQLPSSFA